MWQGCTYNEKRDLNFWIIWPMKREDHFKLAMHPGVFPCLFLLAWTKVEKSRYSHDTKPLHIWWVWLTWLVGASSRATRKGVKCEGMRASSLSVRCIPKCQMVLLIRRRIIAKVSEPHDFEFLKPMSFSLWRVRCSFLLNQFNTFIKSFKNIVKEVLPS